MNYLIWNTDPEMFSLLGRSVRYYGLLFAVGFLIAQSLTYHTFRQHNWSKKWVDKATLYAFISIIIGARLGHILFYDPSYYFTHPAEIPRIDRGGLASHGALVGTFTGMWLFAKQYKLNLKLVYDNLVPAALILSACIRIGNFMNSEIYGIPSSFGVLFAHPTTELLQQHLKPIQIQYQKQSSQRLIAHLRYPTQLPEPTLRKQIQAQLPYLTQRTGFHQHFTLNQDTLLWVRQDPAVGQVAALSLKPIPRHPTQLYESAVYFCLCLIFLWSMKRQQKPLPYGTYTGLLLLSVFMARILIEYIKVPQESFANHTPLNMGQWLSLPCVLAGIYLCLPWMKQHLSR